MTKDYYKILGCGKQATQEELKKAYRKLALKWHPDRCAPEKKDDAQAKFQEIGEAFEVLSDPEKKKVYDQVGFEGMQGMDGGASAAHAGFSGFTGGQSGGQSAGPNVHFSQSNAEDIFRSFFGTSDPMAAGDDGNSFGRGGGRPGSFSFMMGGPGGASGQNMNMNMNMGSMGGMPGMPHGISQQSQSQSHPKKAPATNHTLYVTLEDLYTGTTKRMRITSRRIDPSGATFKVAAEKEIVVKAGWKDGTKITFENEGDDAPGMLPSDVVFILQTKPHARFIREDDDLILTCPVDLKDALCGFNTTVTTVDNRQLRIDMKNVTPDTVKIIPGEGMLNSKKQRRGDLRVKFQIKFPDLSQNQRTQIGSIIQPDRI